MDETLIHCNDSNEDPCDFMVEIDFPDNEVIQVLQHFQYRHASTFDHIAQNHWKYFQNILN